MDLEKVALEAVKVKITEIFSQISVTTAMEGKNIVIRIALPEEIMNCEYKHVEINAHVSGPADNVYTNNLDQEAQQAANELLGIYNE